MAEDAAKVVAIYFNAWKASDFAILRSVLADDVTFVGPLGRADNADDYRQGSESLSQIKTESSSSTRPSSTAPTYY